MFVVVYILLVICLHLTVFRWETSAHVKHCPLCLLWSPLARCWPSK